MKTLIIDNYDSFTYNLFQYFKKLKGNPVIFKNDKLQIEDITKINPQRIVISPGPGTAENPKFFGKCTEIIKKYGPKIPLLGVCLGHQGIAYAYGGKIIQDKTIIHGKSNKIFHNKKGIFKGVKNPFYGMRYHSLIIDPNNLPKEIEVSATLQKNKSTIMGINHKKYPIYGIQFHPESFMTPEGEKIIKNFLNI